LVHRKFRYTFIQKLRGKDAKSVNDAFIHKFNSLPDKLKQKLTWDRAKELAKHIEFTKKTGVPVYFCDHQSP
jgi:IS30 family transposase